MNMNRKQKRMLQKQGEVDADGVPIAKRHKPVAPSQAQERTKPMQFLREVEAELRKVTWPSSAETINYSIVVFVTVVLLTSMIYGLDWVFSTFILELFENS